MDIDEEKGEIRFLGDMQRLSPLPGDVFALTIEGHPRVEHLEIIKRQWDKVMPDHKVIILAGGMRLGVIGGQGNEN